MPSILEKDIKPQEMILAGVEEERNLSYKVVKERQSEKIRGEAVGKICSTSFFVHENALIGTLAEDLELGDEIFALGVVNDSEEVVGVIIRKELLDYLGRLYGRELLTYKPASSVMKTVKNYNFYENIFAVANELKGLLQKPNIHYFALSDNQDKFFGIFSTKDMLVFLSMMTQKDIDLARRLQNRIVKENMTVKADQFNILGASSMAKGVGGDFYAVKQFSENKWFLSICDVSGKGIAASLVTAIIGGMLTTFSIEDGIDLFIKHLNTYLFTNFDLEKYLTGLFMILDTKTGQLTIYDMGHSYIFVLRQGKLVKINSPSENLPIGITDDITPTKRDIHLKPGDLLVTVTDGIIEQVNSKNEEYGVINLGNVVFKNKERSLDEIRNELINDLTRHMATYPQKDDMTLILVKYDKDPTTDKPVL